MADLLGGDTIHHALNETKAQETVKSMLMLRWLIIDDINMVSARLLADIDSQLRTYYRDNYDFARDENKALRP